MQTSGPDASRFPKDAAMQRILLPRWSQIEFAPLLDKRRNGNGLLLFTLVAADVDFSGFDSRRAFNIQFSHRHSVNRASNDRGRI